MPETETPLRTLNVSHEVMPKGTGAASFAGRQKWDMTKITIDNSNQENFNKTTAELADALDEFFEPFAVTMELKAATNAKIQLAPQTQQQAYAVTIVWLKRPALIGEVAVGN